MGNYADIGIGRLNKAALIAVALFLFASSFFLLGGEPWAVGVDRPSGEEFKDVWTSEGKPVGITTSGNYRKFFVRDGKKYFHTINPVTGYPVEHSLLSATVASKVSAAESDAIATWCMVVGLEKAQEIILGDPQLEGYLTYADENGDIKEWISPGFSLRN